MKRLLFIFLLSVSFFIIASCEKNNSTTFDKSLRQLNYIGLIGIKHGVNPDKTIELHSKFNLLSMKMSTPGDELYDRSQTALNIQKSIDILSSEFNIPKEKVAAIIFDFCSLKNLHSCGF